MPIGVLRTFTDKEQLRTCKERHLILINFGLFLLLVCRIRGQTYCKKGKKGYNFDEWSRDFFLCEFPRIQLNYHLGCNQNLELCSSTVLCCSAERSRYDGSTLNPRYQVRTCTAHYSVLKFRWQFCVYRGCPTYTVFTTADPTTAIVWLM